ncbi:kinesin-like protein [Acrasis kona]|uniref:Kinesin-like protein n=1 Tax=Acrasis kona TaxID=1008807 RepID=A0AAW2Z1P6_9EUKA
MADTGMNVKVAVRVRPFNAREIAQNTSKCIKMVGKQTIITDPETGKENPFTYDYSYWNLGVNVLNNAWEGFNTSIFAYGQTGSGKSYSMVGYGEEKGLIPKVSEEMFRRIKSDERAVYRVEASMIEIYNEQVRDLFNPSNPLNKHGLKVRENPQTGPYVEGLEFSTVSSFEEITELMDEGNRMRTIAKTNMNDTSSRAHTIFQVLLYQSTTTKLEDGEVIFSEKSSRINLIDLAGSERQSKTGATGERLKEGASINVSLTTLGNVINKLAELSNADPKDKAKSSKLFVPYRDSVLTWLLKDSLGGNSKTIMIAAISPSDFNYGETLSTLRYANRAKNIKNRAIVNEDSNVAIIRDLKEEVERLRNQLQLLESGEKMVQNEQERARLLDELEASKRLIDNMAMTPVQKVQRSLEVKRMRQKALNDIGLLTTPGGNLSGNDTSRSPFLFNLNEDPLLTGMLVYYLQDGETFVGRVKNQDNGIVLNSSNISDKHAVLEVVEEGLRKSVVLTPVGDSVVYRNGDAVTETTQLRPNDRIIFGTQHVFRFVNPTYEGEITSPRVIDNFDFNYATKELTDIQGIEAILSEKEKEWEENWRNNKLKQLEAEFEAERQKMLQQGFGLLTADGQKEAEIEINRRSALNGEVVPLGVSAAGTDSDVGSSGDVSSGSYVNTQPMSAEEKSMIGFREEKRTLNAEEANSSIMYHDGNSNSEPSISPNNSKDLFDSIASGKSIKTGDDVGMTRSVSFGDRVNSTIRKISGRKPVTKDGPPGKKLDKHLMRTLPLIKEANEIVKDLKMNVSYDLKILIKNEAPHLYVQLFDRSSQKGQLLSMVEFENSLHYLKEKSSR